MIAKEQYRSLSLANKKAIERLIEQYCTVYESNVREGKSVEHIRLVIHDEWTGLPIAGLSVAGLDLYVK